MEISKILAEVVAVNKSNGKTCEETMQDLLAIRDLAVKIQNYEEVYKRSVFKKSVMTVSAYGAKSSTSREDVVEQLKDLDSQFLVDCSNEELKLFCKMVFMQIGVSLPAAKDYLTWARKLTYQVAKAVNCISYKHPLTGYPVYASVENVEKTKYVGRFGGGKLFKTVLNTPTGVFNSTKTSTAAVPLMIHSTDAAILDLTAEKMMGHKLPMALIHDSFGSTPNSMSYLNDYTNESLADVYNTDILQDICDQLLSQIKVSVDGCDTLESIEEASRQIKIAKKIYQLNLHEVPFQNTYEDMEDNIIYSEHAFS